MFRQSGYDLSMSEGSSSSRMASTEDLKPVHHSAFLKSRLEKSFALFSVVLVCAVVGLIVGIVVISTSDDSPETLPNICTTPGCASAAARVLTSVDSTVNPCDDFYEYACGTWMRKNVIPEDSSSQNVFGVLRDEVQVINKYLLEGTTGGEGSTAITKVRDTYYSCVDEEAIEGAGANVILPLLDDLGGWPVLGSNPGGNWESAQFNLSLLLARLAKYSNTPVIYTYQTSDVKESTSRIFYIDQPGFVLPSRDYYLNDAYTPARDAAVTLAASVAMALGANETTAFSDMRDVLELETELANISMKPEDRRDNDALYNKMTIDQLEQNFTGPTGAWTFSWLNYFQQLVAIPEVGLSVDGSEPVVVRAVPYFNLLFNVLEKYEPKTITNYIVWTIMQYRTSNLPRRFRDLVTEYNEVVYGTAVARARWRNCVDYSVGQMGMAIGQLFVRETFDETAKSKSLEMIKNIRSAFYELLDELDWMDDETKVLAREKAAAMNDWIGYPDDILDNDHLDNLYANVTVDRLAYFGNVLENLQYSAKVSLASLRQPYEKNIWTTPPSTVNAFYNSILNNIMFPGGILQPPFYSGDQPESMNYGGIGVVIGHEITHGFDDRGRQYDKDGNLRDWWNEAAVARFKDKAQCIVDQYSEFVIPEGDINVNGQNTQGENIADNGGLRQSFRAYRRWVESRGSEEPLLPGVHFTHNQLFFVNFAQIWCNNLRRQAAINAVLTGVHSPGRFRVLGTLQNSPDFSTAFNCPSGAKMNPANKCAVW